MHLAVDCGSTHMGKREYCKEIIRVAKDNGADSVKFQLFKQEDYPHNIELNRDLFGELVSYGKEKEIMIAASAFDMEAVELLKRLQVGYIKLAFSQRKKINLINSLTNIGTKVVVTTDEATMKSYKDSMHLKMLCVDHFNGVSAYPVPWKTDFEGKFPMFDGYSDHHTGLGTAITAAKMGAKWIEKHFSLPYDDCKTVPDWDVSMSPRELYELAKVIK